MDEKYLLMLLQGNIILIGMPVRINEKWVELSYSAALQFTNANSISLVQLLPFTANEKIKINFNSVVATAIPDKKLIENFDEFIKKQKAQSAGIILPETKKLKNIEKTK
jgi:hypothetical protein